MNSKSKNIKSMIGNETNEIINGLFSSLLTKYQVGQEESMKDSEFVLCF